MTKQFTLLFALLLFVAGGLQAQKGYKVGDSVEDFSLKNVDGKMVSMADYEDAKGFIVVFTCNHCPYAKMYEQRIMDLDKKYASQGFPVIAINPNDPKKVPDDSPENMKARAEEKGYTFPYLFDQTQDVARAFGASYTPHVFVINKEDGELVLAYIGAIDDNYKNAKDATKFYVEDAVEALMDGARVENPAVKGIGCSIKWRKS